eukprot:TRINITY_DN24352_c0_g1_i1.p1 TRINITY_DN24352_c0_g1~~TRINITY_DN24352_c0_g1_i1.p1  ORF type:complete len:770 (+),score=161.08 TRINITY_DN24352_c0_g1_i1:35-2311(+)
MEEDASNVEVQDGVETFAAELTQVGAEGPREELERCVASMVKQNFTYIPPEEELRAQQRLSAHVACVESEAEAAAVAVEGAQCLTEVPALLPQTLGCKFRLEPDSVIGQGAYAVVCKIQCQGTLVRHALKVMASEPLRRRGLQEQAMHEMTVQQELKHPNIVRVIQTLEIDEHCWMVLELAELGSLSQLKLQQSSRRLEEAQAAGFLRQVASAMAYLHQEDVHIIHRDIKADNVLIFQPDVCKLGDFGACVPVLQCLTQCGALPRGLAGTVSHMAPEVLSGEAHGSAADVWSFGVLVAELLTDRLPFENAHHFLQESSIKQRLCLGVASDTFRKLYLRLLRPDQLQRMRADEILEMLTKELPNLELGQGKRREEAQAAAQEAASSWQGPLPSRHSPRIIPAEAMPVSSSAGKASSLVPHPSPGSNSLAAPCGTVGASSLTLPARQSPRASVLAKPGPPEGSTAGVVIQHQSSAMSMHPFVPSTQIEHPTMAPRHTVVQVATLQQPAGSPNSNSTAAPDVRSATYVPTGSPLVADSMNNVRRMLTFDAIKDWASSKAPVLTQTASSAQVLQQRSMLASSNLTGPVLPTQAAVRQTTGQQWPPGQPGNAQGNAAGAAHVAASPAGGATPAASLQQGLPGGSSCAAPRAGTPYRQRGTQASTAAPSGGVRKHATTMQMAPQPQQLQRVQQSQLSQSQKPSQATIQKAVQPYSVCASLGGGQCSQHSPVFQAPTPQRFVSSLGDQVRVQQQRQQHCFSVQKR